MKKVFILGMLTFGLVLTGCGGTTPNPSNSDNPTTPSNPSTSVTEPSTSIEEQYYIILRASSGVELTSTHKKAAEGTAVVLTVNVKGGYTLINVKVNDVVINAAEDGKYNFVMPNEDVVVTTQTTVEGDITVNGDISFPLAKEGDIYVARDIEVLNRSDIYFQIKGEGQEVTEMGAIEIDPYKTFADLEVVSGARKGVSIAGGAKYDFFFDPQEAHFPIWIQKTEQIILPNDSSSLQSMFSGSVKTTNTANPDDLIGVDYTNTLTFDKYHFDLYEDGSYSEIKHMATNKNLGVEYHSVQNDKYVVVDSYINKNNQISKGDRTRYSGIYNITESDETIGNDYSKNDVYAGINVPTHNYYSFDFDIHEGYRTGFDTEWNEFLKHYTNEVTSTLNDDGSFKTNVKSTKTFDNDPNKGKVFIKYDIDFNFDIRGALLDASYEEVHFDDTAYDFDGNKFFPGGENNGTTFKEVGIAYTYGEISKGKIDKNVDSYFADSINVTLKDNKDGVDNVINEGSNIKKSMIVTLTPTTALDAQQFVAIDSSDNDIVGGRFENSSNKDWIARKIGKTTVTFGNNVTNDVTTTIDVEVINKYDLRAYTFVSYDFQSHDAIVNADTVKLPATLSLQVKVVPNPQAGPKGFVVKSDYEDMFSVTQSGYDNDVVLIDATKATNVTSETKLTFTVTSTVRDFSYKMNVILVPYEGLSPVGKWNCQDEEMPNSFFEMRNDKTGVMNLENELYTFDYRFDAITNRITFIADNHGEKDVFIYGWFHNGELWACAYTRLIKASEGGFDSEYEDILGLYVEDGEGGTDAEHTVLVQFTR